MKRIILIIIFLQISANLFSAVLFDPQLKWRSIKTEHFWIHYHQGIEEEAVKLSAIAEKVHKRLSPVIKWKPSLRTDVILVDNLYTANGFATPVPFNRVQIYLTRPELDSELSNFDDWLEMVFTHEYTHILDIDSIHGAPVFTRYTFGRCCFPNAYLPMWMLEGSAVYHESDYSKFGRNNSTYTDMVMRTEILDNNLKPISKASNFPREWPAGSVPYLYGGLFVDFLEKKYGIGRFDNVMTNNSYNLIPYRDNTITYILPFIYTASEWEYGKGETSWKLWNEWEEYIKVKYSRQIADIKRDQLTEYEKITESGYRTVIPRFSSNGRNLYYIRNTNYNKTALMSYSPETGKHRVLCRVNDPNSISVADNDMLYISDAEFYRSYSIYNEAFVFNRGSYKKLTGRLKGSYIDITRDKKKVCFIKQDKNKFSLILADPGFSKQESLIAGSDIQLAFSRFSPDGKKIAFTLKENNGNADIAVIDLTDGSILRLTNDGYNDIHPSWHPDGSRIIFASDRDGGAYNLHEIDLSGKRISGLTNLLGGAFSPDISPDGSSIVFSCYGKNGFDIALMKYPEKIIKTQNADIKNLPVQFFAASVDKTPAQIKPQSGDFTVLNTVFPSYWIPWPLPFLMSNEVYEDKYEYVGGLAVYGSDTLYKNMYYADAYAFSFQKRAQVDLYYLFGYLYPDIILEYHDDAIFFGEDKFPWADDNDDKLKRELERKGVFGIAFPFYYYLSAHIASLSYHYSKTFTDIYYPGFSTQKYRDTEAKIRAKYLYSSALQYSYSISREDGRDFSVLFDSYREELGSDLTYYVAMGEYAEYLPGIWRNNVIMARLRGGASFDNPYYKAPFTLGRFKKGDTDPPAVDEDEFGLRGYPYGRIFGNRIAAVALEYRLPVIQKDFGLATFPVMFRDLWLTPFVEYGNVWETETTINDFKTSAGIELNLRLTLGYSYNLQGYIGYARGFDKYGEDQIYFAISAYYEGAFKNNYKWLDYL
ncbi:MAG: PD40 domain-containing protein [Spirochaetes bacterium]|nr:PD40 domain-containing protein [Spirochaetota bacterium]